MRRGQRRLAPSIGVVLSLLLGPASGAGVEAQRSPDVRSAPAIAPDSAAVNRPAAAYSFLHAEQTPDALGPYFGPTSDGRPPNLVVIMVEGLGRSFSGPDAPLGSFTPFLDELAGRSLYFEHFLSNQGRTFGVLPVLFGSLPLAEQGFTALGDAMPPHAGLFNVLRRQGYRTAFYLGFNASFDNMRTYLRKQGVDELIELRTFGGGYQRNPHSEWGYPDRELIARVLADSARLRAPFVVGMKTTSMHTVYKFPGQEEYLPKVEARLQALRMPEVSRASYRAQKEIYSAILYTDDQLRHYFEVAARQPWYANTIFVITGDHRLAEIPQNTYLERFHVPLLIHSPLLRRTARIGAVSSHLDVTPSLLALLANTYGLQRPAQVTWTGSGLDLHEGFRNLHEIPMKLAKTSVPDYVSGRWFLRDGQLWELQEGMRTGAVSEPRVRALVAQRLQGYLQANTAFLQAKVLSPEGDTPALVPYREATATASGAVTITAPGLGIDGIRVTSGTDSIRVRVTFTNGDSQLSATFVPFLVLQRPDGRELQERAGAPLRLMARGRQEVILTLKSPSAGGRYYVSVRPSDPRTRRPVGRGRYRIPVDIAAGPS